MAAIPTLVLFLMRSFALQVVLKEKAVKGSDGSFTLSTGEKISADIVYMSTGVTPNTTFLKGALKGSLTAAGTQIQVCSSYIPNQMDSART